MLLFPNGNLWIQETPNTGSRNLREQDSTVPTDADPSTAVSVSADRRGRKSLSRDATNLVAVDGDILHSAQKRDPSLDAAQDPVVFDGGEDVVVGRNRCCVPETPATAARHDVPDLFERDLDLVEPTRDPGGPTGQKSSAVLKAGVSSRPDDWVSRLMSQPASECWAKVFNNDATPTLAVLDRLLHPAETAVIHGKSYRIKDQIENSEVGALTRSIRGRRPPSWYRPFAFAPGNTHGFSNCQNQSDFSLTSAIGETRARKKPASFVATPNKVWFVPAASKGRP